MIRTLAWLMQAVFVLRIAVHPFMVTIATWTEEIWKTKWSLSLYLDDSWFLVLALMLFLVAQALYIAAGIEEENEAII